MPFEFILIYLNLKITMCLLYLKKSLQASYDEMEICEVNESVLHFNNRLVEGNNFTTFA